MDQDTLLRRPGEYPVTAVGDRRPPVLAGRRHAFAEWHVGLMGGRGWRTFTSRTGGDLDRDWTIDLGVDGEPVTVSAGMVLLYLAPVLSAPLVEVVPILQPPVAELARVWREIGDPPSPGRETPWVEVYLLETGRTYHARSVERWPALPPDAEPYSYRLLELSDRPFADWPGGPVPTPRSAGRTG